MTDTKRFKAVLTLKGMTAGELAEKIGTTHASISLKIRNKREFKASEIARISEVLKLSLEEKEQIFFAQPVDK